MIVGFNQWNQFITRGMGFHKPGNREVFTFDNMKNNFYEILETNVEKTPDKILFVDDQEKEYSFEKFIQMVDDLALALSKENIGKNSHVGLLLQSSIEFAAGFYAVCKIGAVAVPFPSKYRQHELQSLIDKSDLDIMFACEEFGEWLSKYEKKGLRIVYSVNEEKEYGFKDFATEKGQRGNSVAALNDEVIMMFTSGTTSESKGVILKNYNIIHAVMIYQRTLNITSEDKTVIPVPIYHITGLIALLGLFVYVGGTVYLHRRYKPEHILSCIQKNGITFMHGSPTVFGILLDYRDKYPDLPSIRTLACGSSYMPIEKIGKLHSWMPNMELQIVYGMTETSSPGMVFPYDAATSIYKGAVGKVIPGLELKICDDDKNELPINETGVIYIRGANILEYYYKINTDLIDEDGWLDTGDCGFVNADGYVFIVDRKKDIINRGGEKIWCTDVEEALVGIDEIKDAAVVGIPNEKYGEVAAAVVVLNKDTSISAEKIKKELEKELARYKIPEQIKFVEEIPKTPGLKTDKKFIRTLF